mgnify:CR=1 FL=1
MSIRCDIILVSKFQSKEQMNYINNNSTFEIAEKAIRIFLAVFIAIFAVAFLTSLLGADKTADSMYEINTMFTNVAGIGLIALILLVAIYKGCAEMVADFRKNKAN